MRKRIGHGYLDIITDDQDNYGDNMGVWLGVGGFTYSDGWYLFFYYGTKILNISWTRR